jgi:ribonuclease-3
LPLFKSSFLAGFFSSPLRQYATLLHKILGFQPKRIALYQQALRHKSMVRGGLPAELSNERLEFLGDAILNAVISEYLFQQFETQNEGELTRMRTKVVNGLFLNELALKLGIDQLLETGIGEHETPRAIYGNALEALIGAVYLDKGHEVAKRFILHQLLQMENRLETIKHAEPDHKSKLVEWSQKEKVEVEFVVEEALIDDRLYAVKLIIADKAMAEGRGLTKKEAEQEAAKRFFEQRH